LHGKNVVKIETIKKVKVRRSKLYYARELRGKAARMVETHISEVVLDEEADKKAAAELKKKEDETAAKAEAAKVEQGKSAEDVAETAENIPTEESAAENVEKEK
jgi:hypothetical protein